jgi:hypothetical protein
MSEQDAAAPPAQPHVAASISVTNRWTRVLDWAVAVTVPSPSGGPACAAQVAPLVVAPGQLLALDNAGLVVDGWLVLLFLSATADALWTLAGGTRTRLEATATGPLSHVDALEAIAEARHLRFHEGAAVPSPSPMTTLWHRWAGIHQVFGLSLPEMRQLFAGQHTAGPPVVVIPAAVAAKVDTVAELMTVFQHRLKPERIAPVVRRPADAYGGLSMLQMIAADRHEELARSVAESFNWGSTA